jgi:hypothetical protein
MERDLPRGFSQRPISLARISWLQCNYGDGNEGGWPLQVPKHRPPDDTEMASVMVMTMASPSKFVTLVALTHVQAQCRYPV